MFTTLILVAVLGQVPAQNVKPRIGYVYPPGASAGSTVDVMLGTYDWTPDMELFVVHARRPNDPPVKIEITGPASDFLMAPPPYWSGEKAGQAQPPLPRELPARITIPADMPPGPVRWQAANANGALNAGSFVVSSVLEIVEPARHDEPIELPSLPAVVSGRLSKITEIDVYRFQVSEPGLVTCRLDDQLGQPFNGVLTVRDEQNRLVVDHADTTGSAIVQFAASAGQKYLVSVNDVEFGGDRGYVYRLSIMRGPRVVTMLPLVVARGSTQSVEFIGWGVATGALKLESVTHSISIPANVADESFIYTFETPAGRATATVAVGSASDLTAARGDRSEVQQLQPGRSIAGVFSQSDPRSGLPVDRYQFTAQKGDDLRLSVEAARFGSPVDPTIAIVSAEGKRLARNDDAPGAIDAAVDFLAPADGMYDLLVSDVSGIAPSLASVYRLSLETAGQGADFTLQVPERFEVPLGSTASLSVKVVRQASWNETVAFLIDGLPAGVTSPAEMQIAVEKNPKKKVKNPGTSELKIVLTCTDQVAAGASLATVTATTTVDGRVIEHRSEPMLVATTLKTRCVVKSAVQDGGRIVNRGTTYPAEILVERLEEYTGPVTLQMAATQSRQRRGIVGGELVVAAGVDRVLYPVFMPEWLETSLTARIALIGIAQVADPKGNVRHVTGIMDGQTVMSMEGGLMKLSHDPQERVVELGGTIDIPVRLTRGVKVPEPARIELRVEEPWAGLFTAAPLTLPVKSATGVVKLRVADDPRLLGLRQVTIRATVMQDKRWPAVSETTVPLVITGRSQ